MLGGEITVPTPRTTREMKTLKVKREAGEYAIGELVVPKQYRKLILNSDGTLKEVLFTVSGRKIPLAEISKRELERCEQLGIVRGHTNQEYEQMSDEHKERLKVMRTIWETLQSGERNG
ncbi:uncharacterized protein [Montipora foliosa]|uniref:uncharacterized protein n=1 Tax=Montipora foliosa TaxID=591990 RepID=UPI0035F1BA66